MSERKFIKNAYDEKKLNWKILKVNLRKRLTYLTNTILGKFGDISVPPDDQKGPKRTNISMFNGCSGILFGL